VPEVSDQTIIAGVQALETPLEKQIAGYESEKTDLAAALESEKTELSAALAPAGPRREPAQLGLFPTALHPIVKELSQLDVGSLTPLQALNLLAAWQERLRERP